MDNIDYRYLIQATGKNLELNKILSDAHLAEQRLALLSCFRPGMSFSEWLLEFHGYTPERFRDIALATGSPKLYLAALAWFITSYEGMKSQFNSIKQLTINDIGGK